MHKTTHPHYALYVTLKTKIPNTCSPALHYQHTSHPLTYGMTLWPWWNCWHSGTMPWGCRGWSGIPVGIMVTGMGKTRTHTVKPVIKHNPNFLYFQCILDFSISSVLCTLL